MSLLPYLLNDLRPRRRAVDRLLSLDLADDLMTGVFDPPAFPIRKFIRPLRHLASIERDAGSSIKVDKEKFQISVDVQHFDPEEISVKTSDGYIVVEGKHEERQDDHGYISRQFKRRYALPEDCNPDTVESKLSSDGVLTVVAPKSRGEKGERAIPITHTGPVRRQAIEEDEVQNGEVEEEVKTPQKKRRR